VAIAEHDEEATILTDWRGKLAGERVPPVETIQQRFIVGGEWEKATMRQFAVETWLYTLVGSGRQPAVGRSILTGGPIGQPVPLSNYTTKTQKNAGADIMAGS